MKMEYDNLAKAKQAIQKLAWKKFPARELWIKNDNTFIAYDFEKIIDDRFKIYITDGNYNNETVNYSTNYTIHVENNDRENYIDRLCESFIEAGYECFATELRV
jgi:hypothetical protein